MTILRKTEFSNGPKINIASEMEDRGSKQGSPAYNSSSSTTTLSCFPPYYIIDSINSYEAE